MFSSKLLFWGFLYVLPYVSLAIFAFGSGSEEDTSNTLNIDEDVIFRTESCPAAPLGGVQWILRNRQSDYGWKENTHRAVIALVVSDWTKFTKESERRLMEQQLEVEVTKALLRNGSFPIYPNNLALYIHALIAINRNPRNFHNIDLVVHLMDMMHRLSSTAHPYLLLALCNAKSLDRFHLDILEYYLRNPLDSRQNMEYKALALQAYECAGTIDHYINETFVYDTQRYLASQQYPDGSFGNVYTTALIVQALGSPPYLQWNKAGAIKYLKEQSFIDVNMVSTYLIQLALNSDKVRFIKDLHPDLSMGRVSETKHKDNFIQYSLRVGLHPNVHHTISINVPPESNLFEIMKLSAQNDPKYNFSYYLDKNNEPNVYAISNIPNDAEENYYWRLCLQKDIDHNRHKSTVSTIHHSPVRVFPKSNEHVIYWYMDRECEEDK